MRESESGTLPRAKVWYGAKPNNRVSQQTQAKSELLAKGGLDCLWHETASPFPKFLNCSSLSPLLSYQIVVQFYNWKYYSHRNMKVQGVPKKSGISV